METSAVADERRPPLPATANHAWLSAIVETAMDAIVITDEQQRIVFANRAVGRVFGWPPDELLGRPLDVLLPDAARERHAVHVRRFGTEGVATRLMEARTDLPHGSIRGLHREGRDFPLEASISTFLADGTRLYAATLRDITGRLRAEAERYASERLLDSVISRLPIALTVTDRDGEITLSTGGALSQTGLYPGVPVGESIFTALGDVPADTSRERTTMAAIARRVLAGETVESSTTLPGGVALRNYSMPRHDSAGDVTGIIGLSHDVTHLLQLEDQLRQAQKLQAVGQLAGGIAHDFNNLLTILSSNLELAGADVPPAWPPEHPLRGALEEMTYAVGHARALVRQLLTFSRTQPVQLRPVRVGEVVRQTRRLLQRLLGEEITLEVTDHAPGAAVRADTTHIEQVLLNLALNARDAMLTATHGHPGTGGTLSITVDCVNDDATDAPNDQGRRLRLRVRDTGHGMDVATRNRIFEPFFSTKPPGRGTGLGLATVYGIVQQMGGSLAVDSEPGHGTTFTLLWPLTDPVERTDAIEPQPLLASPQGQTLDPAGDAGSGTRGEPNAEERVTLLLVEDEAVVRMVTSRMLRRGGYDVIEARHGVDALGQWTRHQGRIAAIVTDCRMPELGGRALARALRADRPSLPVVYVSGYSEDNDALEIGDVFVAKPFSGPQLLEAIASARRQTLGEDHLA
jgi:two-component system cell cycle sensor histidine kinase/response regulator CckA